MGAERRLIGDLARHPGRRASSSARRRSGSSTSARGASAGTAAAGAAAWASRGRRCSTAGRRDRSTPRPLVHTTARPGMRRSPPCICTSTRLSTVPISRAVLHVQGWSFDESSPVRDVTILLDGLALGRAGLAWPRPDVAAGFGDPRLGLCGFDRVRDAAARTARPRADAPSRWRRACSTAARAVRRRWRSLLPAVSAAARRRVARRRPHLGGRAVHSVWLARSLDHGGSQLRMAETSSSSRAAGGPGPCWPRPMVPCGPAWRRPAREVRLIEPVPLDDASSLSGGGLPAGRRAGGRRPRGRAHGDVLPAGARGGTGRRAAPCSGSARRPRSPPSTAWLSGHLDVEVEEHARRAISGAAAIWTNAHAVEATYRALGYDGAWSVIHTGRPALGELPSRAEARQLLGLPPTGGSSSARARSGRSRGRGCWPRPSASHAGTTRSCSSRWWATTACRTPTSCASTWRRTT